MQANKEAIGITSFTFFLIVFFIVFIAACFYVFQDVANYLVNSLSVQSTLTYR